MTFSNWLDTIGLVVSRFITWIGYCFDSLKNNYIVLTFLGITIFIILFDIVFSFINKIRYIRLVNLFEKGSINSLSNKQVKFLDKHTNPRALGNDPKDLYRR